MTVTLTSALATTFDWASAGAGLDGKITIAATPYTITVPTTADVRMLLAPSTNDFIRIVETAINTAVMGSGKSFTLAMGADGRLVLSIDSGVFDLVLSLPLNRTLGFLASGTGIASVTADTQPWYFGAWCSLSGGAWRPAVGGGATRTNGGAVYAIAATATAFERTMRGRWIPWDYAKAQQIGSAATPMYPAMSAFTVDGDLTTARQWSWLDVLWWARNARCALALSNLQDLLTSTSEYYYLGWVAPPSLLNQPIDRQDEFWPTYTEADFSFVLPTTGSTATRA